MIQFTCMPLRLPLAVVLLAAGPAAASGLEDVPALEDAPFAEWTAGLAQSFVTWRSAERPQIARGASSLRLGTSLFRRRLELAMELPLRQPAVGSGAVPQDLGVIAGRWYPWALDPGAVRPFVSVSLAIVRRPDVETRSSGRAHELRVPAGAGLSARLPFGLALDLVADVPADGPVNGPVVRLGLGARAIFDPAPGTGRLPGFREQEAVRWRSRFEGRARSGLTLGIGPSWRPVAEPDVYQGRYFLDVALGYHVRSYDSELRLAYRGLDTDPSANTARHAVFAEALRMFDLHVHGIAPFIGMGLGVDFTNGGLDPGPAIAPSLLLGWAYRPTPGAPWLLRTGLRWIPGVMTGVDDFSGLELDLVQLVIFPVRMLE